MEKHLKSGMKWLCPKVVYVEILRNTFSPISGVMFATIFKEDRGCWIICQPSVSH